MYIDRSLHPLPTKADPFIPVYIAVSGFVATVLISMVLYYTLKRRCSDGTSLIYSEGISGSNNLRFWITLDLFPALLLSLTFYSNILDMCSNYPSFPSSSS